MCGKEHVILGGGTPYDSVSLLRYCNFPLICEYAACVTGSYLTGRSSSVQTGKHSTTVSGSQVTKYGIENRSLVILCSPSNLSDSGGSVTRCRVDLRQSIHNHQYPILRHHDNETNTPLLHLINKSPTLTIHAPGTGVACINLPFSRGSSTSNPPQSS